MDMSSSGGNRFHSETTASRGRAGSPPGCAEVAGRWQELEQRRGSENVYEEGREVVGPWEPMWVCFLKLLEVTGLPSPRGWESGRGGRLSQTVNQSRIDTP